MNEETLSFGLLLLVAAASVFSVLFLHDNTTTGHASKIPVYISDEIKARTNPCIDITCPYGYQARPVFDEFGRYERTKIGADAGPGGVVCECPVTPVPVSREGFVRYDVPTLRGVVTHEKPVVSYKK